MVKRAVSNAIVATELAETERRSETLATRPGRELPLSHDLTLSASRTSALVTCQARDDLITALLSVQPAAARWTPKPTGRVRSYTGADGPRHVRRSNSRFRSVPRVCRRLPGPVPESKERAPAWVRVRRRT